MPGLALTLALALAGCGHDWSAGDADDATGDDADATGGEDVELDDGGLPDVPDADADADAPSDADDAGFDDVPPVDADDDGVEDAAADDAVPDVPPCPVSFRCSSDGGSVEVCDPATGLWSSVPCTLPCVDDGLRARCAELMPSNLPLGESWLRGATDLVCDEGTVIADAATGAIVWRRSGGTVSTVRNAGDGIVDGIPFTTYVSADDAPTLAAWSLAYLEVGEACTVAFTGAAAAAALLLEADAVIRGRITVAAGFVTGSPGTAGPGGGAGGAPGAAGGGPGGGRPGAPGAWDEDGGSGGGGHGGSGGAGGTTMYGDGGPGGASHGAATLTPLVGGSGGAGGVEASGGIGGGGGGALQISTQGSIWLGATGRIDAGGGGGQGGLATGPNAGSGGGGGAGGAILLEAAHVELAGIVAANGGGGGAGGDDTAGSGLPGQPGTPDAAAAPAGLGSGEGLSGGEGSSATAPVGRDAEDSGSSADDNGGGGGGGAGRIRINGLSTDLATAVLSPMPSTGLATVGTPALR
jgi:hypothetical protein